MQQWLRLLLALAGPLGPAWAHESSSSCTAAGTLAPITAACCGAGTCGARPVPAKCAPACATAFLPLWARCSRELSAADSSGQLAAFSRLCSAAAVTDGPPTAADRARALIVGALVGDAAAMPLHWIYSGAQISRTVGRGNDPEFYAVPQCTWYSYTTGQLSPFGQQGMVYLRTLAEAAGREVDPAALQAAYYSYYGPGGDCASPSTCYADTCTRGFVANVRAGRNWPECGAKSSEKIESFN